jgi:hypothetical protein
MIRVSRMIPSTNPFEPDLHQGGSPGYELNRFQELAVKEAIHHFTKIAAVTLLECREGLQLCDCELVDCEGVRIFIFFYNQTYNFHGIKFSIVKFQIYTYNYQNSQKP